LVKKPRSTNQVKETRTANEEPDVEEEEIKTTEEENLQDNRNLVKLECSLEGEKKNFTKHEGNFRKFAKKVLNPFKTNSRDSENDDFFKANHEHLLTSYDLELPDNLKFVNSKKWKNLAKKKSSDFDLQDEEWGSHKQKHIPQRLSWNFFTNMNLISWGGVYEHDGRYDFPIRLIGAFAFLN